MSTVHEVTVAHHCGIKVLGFSLITNMCVDEYDDDSTPKHEDVVQMSNRRAQDLERLVSLVLKKLNHTGTETETETEIETEPNHLNDNGNDHHSIEKSELKTIEQTEEQIEQPTIQISEVNFNESSLTNGNESDGLNEMSNSLITE